MNRIFDSLNLFLAYQVLDDFDERGPDDALNIRYLLQQSAESEFRNCTTPLLRMDDGKGSDPGTPEYLLGNLAQAILYFATREYDKGAQNVQNSSLRFDNESGAPFSILIAKNLASLYKGNRVELVFSAEMSKLLVSRRASYQLDFLTSFSLMITTATSALIQNVENWYSAAEDAIDYCHKLLVKESLAIRRVRVLQAKGNLLSVQRKSAEASKFYEEAVSLFETCSGNFASYKTELLIDASLPKAQLKLWEEARNFCSLAIDNELMSNRDALRIAKAFRLLAETYHWQGEKELAFDSYFKSLSFYDQASRFHEAEQLVALHQIIGLAKTLGHRSKIPSFEAAIARLQKRV